MDNGQKQLNLDILTPAARKDIESWVVNTVKIKLIRKFEEILEIDGKSNLRKLFLVPVFSIVELTDRIKNNAPELLTVYYKELFASLDDVSDRLS